MLGVLRQQFLFELVDALLVALNVQLERFSIALNGAQDFG